MTVKSRIVSATPLICLIVYLTIGFFQNIWTPTWVIFFLIPIMPIILSDSWVRNLYPFFAVIVYVGLSIYTGMWHPLWLILLTIPVYYILVGPSFGIKRRHEFKESN